MLHPPKEPWKQRRQQFYNTASTFIIVIIFATHFQTVFCGNKILVMPFVCEFSQQINTCQLLFGAVVPVLRVTSIHGPLSSWKPKKREAEKVGSVVRDTTFNEET
jgi:hypothetical protein